MSGLRFCFLTTFYPPFNFGGDGIAVQRLARGLVRAGHEVTVIHDADAYTTLAPTAAAPDAFVTVEPPGLSVVTLRSRLGSLSALLTQQLGRPVVHGRRIARLLDAGGFDVINFHNVSLVGGPGILKYGRGIKVYMAHEHWLVCPTHVLWRHGREPCPARQCVRCQLAHRRPPQPWRFTGHLERALRHVDTFIAMSEFSRRKHREFGFPREMEVVPAFLPPAVTREPAASEPPHPRPYYLFVGRLERMKGVHDLLPLFSGAGEVDLLIAGDGTESEALRRAAASSPRVRFLGRVTPDALAAYYRGAVALVVPSLGFETFGVVLLEAFQHGTPVIARRIGPAIEMIEETGGGALFSNADELRTLLQGFHGDGARRAAAGAAARRGFDARWREEVVIPRYLDVIRETAARRGAAQLVARLAPPGEA